MIVISYLLQLLQCPVLGNQVVDIFYSSITEVTVHDASVSEREKYNTYIQKSGYDVMHE